MAIHPLRAALTLLLAVPLLVLSAGGPAHACSCAEQTPQGLVTSDVAFAGTVEDSRTSLTRFAVDRVWTGDVARITEVVHGSMEAACGLTTREGERMLVAASYAEDGDLRTNLCLVRVGAAVVDRYTQELGPGEPPGTGMVRTAGEPPDDGPPWRRIGIGAGLLLALVAAVVVRRRAWD